MENTSSVPTALTAVKLVVPPRETVSKPPLLTVVLTAVPPEDTRRVPTLLTVVKLATPLDNTSAVPPLLTTVATAVPPDDTNRKSPLLSVRPVLVWPDVTLKVAMAVCFLAVSRRPYWPGGLLAANREIGGLSASGDFWRVRLPPFTRFSQRFGYVFGGSLYPPLRAESAHVTVT
jgi:hypothetical protein